MHHAISAKAQPDRSYLIPASRANYVCSEEILLYFNFLGLLFVYWLDYILKQEVDIKPTMLYHAARPMVAQNISNLLW